MFICDELQSSEREKKINKKEMRRSSEVHQDGQDISMATKGCYRWTGHLSQTGRDRRLLKMT